MSLSVIRPYYRARLNNLGYREWKDGFNTDNLPENILDGSYHIGPVSAVGQQLDQTLQMLEAFIVVTLFLKGYRDPASAIDDGLSKGQGIIEEVMSTSTRFGDELKNIILDTFEVLPYADSNDNSIRVVLTFNNITQVCL